MNDKNKQLAPFHDFHDFFAGNKKETGRKQEKKKKTLWRGPKKVGRSVSQGKRRKEFITSPPVTLAHTWAHLRGKGKEFLIFWKVGAGGGGGVKFFKIISDKSFCKEGILNLCQTPPLPSIPPCPCVPP